MSDLRNPGNHPLTEHGAGLFAFRPLTAPTTPVELMRSRDDDYRKEVAMEKAERTVRDVTISEAQIYAVGRAATRARDPETKAALKKIVEFWHANEATEQVLPG